MAKNRAAFLDRDGVVIEEVNYLSDPRRLRLIPGAAAAIRSLREAGFKVVVVSNQSGVGRGYFTKAALKRIDAKLRRELKKKGARLDAVCYCPHAPEDHCPCRKPKTQMLRRVQRRFKLDFDRSVFIGDATTDVKTARNAGCLALLVRTGHAGKDGNFKIKPDRAFKDLAAAASWVIRRFGILPAP